MHDVLHRVHGVGKDHRVLRSAVVGRACAAVHRRAVSCIPHIIFSVVIAQCQVVVVGDVPVDAGKQLVVALVGREVGKRASVISITVHYVSLYSCHVGDSSGQSGIDAILVSIRIRNCYGLSGCVKLKNLLNMETISKVVPINAGDDKKKKFYEINDNLMRFYFTYVFSCAKFLHK